MLGRTIQNYQVEELLGEGGMGTVYKATDIVLRRPVAVKMLHQHLIRDNTFMERFRNEAILSAQLNHPNVTTLYNFLQDQHDSVIVMELVHGITVEKFLKQNGQLTVDTAVKIVIQALNGVQHAHSRGILHRDLKAANLMLTPEGSVKLMDFGIARLEGSTRLTRADRVVGTLEYMAPELLNGAEPSVQSDLYAIGVLLYELLCGKMPFESSTDITLISQILTKKPIPLQSRIPDLPQSLEAILDKLLQKNPAKRYTSAAALRDALTVIVPTGNLEVKLSNTAPKPLAPTRFASRSHMKPAANPTRLADTAAISERQTTKWVGVRNQLWSLEGKILMAALLFAITILSVWSFTDSDHLPLHEDSTLVQHAPVVKENLPKITPAPNQISEPVIPASFQEEKKTQPLAEVPNEKAPAPARKIKKELNQPTTPVAEAPSRPAEEKKEPEKAIKTASVNLKGETFSAELSQLISSESSYAGQTIWLRTTTPVQVNGTTVVRSGARVRGKIDKVNSKSQHNRAGLWFHLEAVETIDGQWIAVSYKWDDTAFHALELKSGMLIKKIRCDKQAITIII